MKNLAMLHESLIPFVAKKTGSQLLWHNGLSPAEQDELKNETSYLIEENNRHAIFDDGTPLLNDEKVFFGSSIQYVDCSVKSPILDMGIGWLKSM